MSGPTSDETAGPLDPDETDGGDASSSQWLDETEAEIAWRIAGLRIRYCPQCNREFDWDREACDTCDAALRDRSVFAERVADEIFDASTFGTLCERVCPCCNASFNLNVTRCPADGSPLALQRRPGAGSKPEPDPRLMVGKVVGSKWSVKEFISGGGFGWVYRGEGIGLGQRVAIKLLKMNLAASAAHRDLFHSEATILSRLDSPRIVKVVDYGEEGETPYLVMHYLADRPLHKLLRHERLSLREKIEIMRQVALALAEAHGQVTEGDSRPIVHLDLKPEHVFVRRREDELHCTVIDFGLAQMLDATGDGGWSHRIVGTPAYMAGERFDGVVDPRSDIYSFGRARGCRRRP